MTSQRAAAVLLGEVARVMKAFDPNQPRDAEGQWTDTGAGAASTGDANRDRKRQKARAHALGRQLVDLADSFPTPDKASQIVQSMLEEAGYLVATQDGIPPMAAHRVDTASRTVQHIKDPAVYDKALPAVMAALSLVASAAPKAPPLKHRRVKKFLQAVNTVLKFDERKHRRDAEGQFAPKHGPADASGSSAASTARAARAADKASLFAVQSHSAEAHHLAARAHAHAASLFGAGDSGRKFHLDAQQSHMRSAALLGGGASAASTPPVVKPSAAPPSRSPRPPLAKPALTPAQAVQAATEASARAAARATPGAHQLAGHAHKVAAKLFGAGTPEWKKHTEAREQHRLRAQELLSQGKVS